MKTALLVVDMQMLMQENIDKGRDYTSDTIKTHIPALLSAFRAAGKPVFHIRHQQDEKMSEIYPQKESYQAMPCAEAIEGETVYIKQLLRLLLRLIWQIASARQAFRVWLLPEPSRLFVSIQPSVPERISALRLLWSKMRC